MKLLRKLLFGKKESEETKMSESKVLATITDEEVNEMTRIKNESLAAHSIVKTIQKNLAELQGERDKWWDGITTKYELDPDVSLQVDLAAKTISERGKG